MLTDQDFNELIEDMNSEDLSLRAATLKVLREYPSADQRVLPYLERLLHDKTPCLAGIPYIYAEIRLLAAHALAVERAALGINQPIPLKNMVRPVYTGDIVAAERLANIKARGCVEGMLESFAIVRDLGYLPRYDLDLWPFDRYPHPPSAQAQAFSVNGMQQKSREPELVPA
ncbi:MAG: hypothetical protein ACPGWR_04315 [Ardenticatenaceae bacterium]